MAARSKDTPDLFAQTALDPVESATGYAKLSSQPPDTGLISAASPGKSDNSASKKRPVSIFQWMFFSALPSNSMN